MCGAILILKSRTHAQRERERERPPAAPRRDGTFYRGGAGVQGTTVSPSKRGRGGRHVCTTVRTPICAPLSRPPATPPAPTLFSPFRLLRLVYDDALNPPWRGCPHRGRPGARRGETEAPRRTGRPADAGTARVPRATTGGTRPESRVPDTDKSKNVLLKIEIVLKSVRAVHAERQRSKRDKIWQFE
jgi:hypothetical protein